MGSADDRTDVWVAVTFAEAGEWDTARRYAPRPGRSRVGAWLERHLLAAALAEEGLRDDAVRLVGNGPPPAAGEEDALDALLRAHGLRMSFGVLSPAALGAAR
ncbi:MAG TPA: hypothetical protein VFL83_08655 [Anaeromyxobacter sp.]|nr:hypothetical protein [Anaeromyxobacter sp.]